MKITQVIMKLNLEKSTHDLDCVSVKQTTGTQEYFFEGKNPRMEGRVSIVEEGRTTKVYTCVRVVQEAFRESLSLAADKDFYQSERKFFIVNRITRGK